MVHCLLSLHTNYVRNKKYDFLVSWRYMLFILCVETKEHRTETWELYHLVQFLYKRLAVVLVFCDRDTTAVTLITLLLLCGCSVLLYPVSCLKRCGGKPPRPNLAFSWRKWKKTKNMKMLSRKPGILAQNRTYNFSNNSECHKVSYGGSIFWSWP
jgi:hypothetical protein